MVTQEFTVRYEGESWPKTGWKGKERQGGEGRRGDWQGLDPTGPSAQLELPLKPDDDQEPERPEARS